MTDAAPPQDKLERITRKWWFFVTIGLLQFIIPPYASKGYRFPAEWSSVSLEAVSYPILSFSRYNPLFKIIPMLLIVSIILIPRRASRLFSIYAGVSYVLFALRPGMAQTEKYGFVINAHWLIVCLTVAGFWFWEVSLNRNDFSARRLPRWKFWVAPLALLAFWYPLSKQTGLPDFNPAHLFTNVSGLAFCTMTPLYVAVLTLYYPKINVTVLRVTSLVGLIIALNNVHLNFIVRPATLWWNGVLHIPLLVISLYGLVVSLKGLPSDVTPHNQQDV
ncbi:MAG: hypothetical protein ACYS4W_09720 [Planctomycetota bacterium]|jgi:hypothetical protein